MRSNNSEQETSVASTALASPKPIVNKIRPIDQKSETGYQNLQLRSLYLKVLYKAGNHMS